MKKLLTLFITLLCGAAWTQAATVSLTSGSQILNGSFYNAAGTSMAYGNWCTKCVTNSDPAVTLTFTDDLSGTGISNTSGYLGVYSTGTRTLTISVPSGCTISSYTFKGTPTAECNFTPAGGTAQSWASGSEGSVTISDVNAQSTTIAFSGCGKDGNNECIIQGVTLTINYSQSYVLTQGDQVTDPSTFSDGDAILLQNSGYYFAGGAGTSNPSTFDMSTVFVLVSTGTAGEFYLVTKSSYDSGSYEYVKMATATSQSPIGAYATAASNAAKFTPTNSGTGVVENSIRFVTTVNNEGGSSTFLNSNGGNVAKYATGTGGWSYWYVYKAALVSSVDYTVNYTQYSTRDNSEIGSGNSVITGTASGYSFTAPTIDGYTFDYATDGDNNTIDLSGSITATTLKLYYTPFNLTGMMVKSTGSAVESLEALTEGYYAIFDANSDRYGYLTDNGTNIGYNHTMTDGTNITSTDYAIYVAPDGSGNYTFRLPNDKYIPAVSRGSSMSTSAPTSTATSFVVTVAEASAFTFNIKNTGNDQYWNANGPSSFNPLCGWDNAHPIKFYPLEIVDPNAVTLTDITLNIMDGSTVLRSATITDAIEGNVYNVSDYFSVSGVTFTPATVTASNADQTISVNYTYASPFPFIENASYDDVTTWYYLKIRPDSKLSYVVYGTGDPNVTCPTSKPEDLNYAKWAFVGSTDPFKGTGLKLVNKAAGSTLILASNTPDGDGNSGGNTYATMETTGTKTYEVWTPEVSTSGTNGFYLKTAGNHYMNLRSNANLAFWTGGHDIGSTFILEEAPDIDKSNLLTLLTYFNAFLPQVTFGTGLGEYSGTTKTEAEAKVSAAQTVYDNASATQTEVNEQVTLLQALATAIQINIPETGKFYRIKGHATNKYLKGSTTAGAAVPNSEGTATDGTDLWYYGSDNCLINYYSGLGLIGTKYVAAVSETKETTTFSQSQCTASGAALVGVYQIQSNYSGSKFWYSNTNNLDRNSVNNHVNCEWDVELVTTLPLTISSAGWATLNSPVAVQIPTGVTAYTGVVNGDYFTLTALSGVIPASTPVILNGPASTYDFVIDYTSTDAAPTQDLSGTVAAEAVSDILTLQMIDEIGLYKYTGTELAGFKAYLSASKLGTGVKGLAFQFDNSTAIKGLAIDSNENAAIYNLAGQRVNRATKGIYIINGKKVVIK